MPNDPSYDTDPLLLQFQEICAIDDQDVARSFLDRFQWDLEVAVQEFLAERDGHSADSSVDQMQNEVNHYVADNNDVGIVQNRVFSRHPIRNRYSSSERPVGWLSWTYSFIALPFKFIFVTLYDIWRFIYRVFFTYNRAITNPAEDVDKFITAYENKYGNVHPVFYRGSYSQALNDAKKELKFLCVYLHCETHHSTDRFCKFTLNNSAVIEFLNTRTLFWACSVRYREGFRVSQAMHETTYPFVSLICARENRMMIVARHEGYLDSDNFLDLLVTTIEDNEIYVNLARQERQNQQQNQVLREQQERAFQESLQQDREKQRKKEEAVLKERRLVEENERRVEQERQTRQNFENRRLAVRRNLPPEPTGGDSRSSPDAPVDTLRINLKFPSGARLERRFLTSDSLQLLFEVAMSHDDCPVNFSVATAFPRRVLLSAHLLTQDGPDLKAETFASAGLANSVALIVQDDEA